MSGAEPQPQMKVRDILRPENAFGGICHTSLYHPTSSTVCHLNEFVYISC